MKIVPLMSVDEGRHYEARFGKDWKDFRLSNLYCMNRIVNGYW